MLSIKTEIKVRFNEVDPMGITWHGHYMRFFEDGREGFGAQYGLGYLDIYKQGYVVPVVSINCDYKKPLEYGDRAIVETTLIDNPAAKIIFKYTIYNPENSEVISTGKSVQVFLDVQKKQLQIISPQFFENWKRDHGLTNGV